MTSKEAFKIGYLSRCVEDGLSNDEILGSVKTASDKLAGLTDAVGKLITTVGGIGVPLALAVPPGLGILGGYGLAKATDVDERDVKDLQRQEVLDTYRRESERARRQKALRDYAKYRQRTGRVFL